MDEFDIIGFLEKNKNIEIGCPKCQEYFSPKRARLFDVRKKYSSQVAKAFKRKENQIISSVKSSQREMKAYDKKITLLKNRESILKHRKTKRPKIVKVSTRRINIGQIVEKILPASRKFKYNIADCRGLFDPIDYISFNGFSINGTVDSISFIEVKTGNANLQKIQKKIRSAIEDTNIKMRRY